MNNPIPFLSNIDCKFSTLTVSKEDDQAIFFKYSGEITRQIIFNENKQKIREIKKDDTRF